MSVLGPIKLTIRQDEQAGLIRMWLVPLQQAEPTENDILVATVNLAVVRQVPGLFDAFRQMGHLVCADATKFMTGQEPTSWHDSKPTNERN